MLYREPCFRWESASMSYGEYDWTICARWRCGLVSNYSDHLSNCHCRSGPNLALERIYPRQISFHLGRRFILSSSSGDEHRKLDRFYCIVLRWRHAAAQTQSRTQLRAPIEWYHKCVSELERLNDDHRASTNFTVQYSKTNVEPRHGRQHIGPRGKWGQKNGWKIKKRKHTKMAVFYLYVIFWEQAGQADVENGAMLTTYLFRNTSGCTISQSNFLNFLRLRRQRDIDPPNQNPADVPEPGSEITVSRLSVIALSGCS